MTLDSILNNLNIFPELKYIIYDFASYKNTFNNVLQELTLYINGQIQWNTLGLSQNSNDVSPPLCMHYLDANRDEITSKQVMYHLAMLDEMEPMFSYLSHENYSDADVYDQYLLEEAYLRHREAAESNTYFDPFCLENLYG